MQFSCGGSVPYCVQCGPRGRGAALCLSTPTTDRDCGDAESTVTDPSDAVPLPTQATCLVGDIMYREGNSIGHIGLECVNETSYDGTASTCGPNGDIITTEMQFS